MNLNDKLQKLIRDKGLKQANIASILNVSRPTVTYWLNGSHKPTDYHLKQLSVFFNIKLIWFTDNTLDYPPSLDYKLNGNGQYSEVNNTKIDFAENGIIVISNKEQFKDDLNHERELNRKDYEDCSEMETIFKDIENSLNSNNINETECLVDRLKVLFYKIYFKLKMGEASKINQNKQKKE